MALTALGLTNVFGERKDSIVTYPITDSTTITASEFVELSSEKLITSVTTLSTVLIGVANTTKTMGVLATSGQQETMGVVTEGLIKVKGLVEGSGGTYTTAISVGTKVSFHYSSTTGYGQFVVNSGSAPIGTVVFGSVASSGTTTDYWDYVLVQLDFEAASSGGSSIADGAVTTAKLGAGSVTGTKIATGGITSSVSFAAGVITNSQIANGTLAGTKFAAGAISSSAYITDAIITRSQLGVSVPAQINATKQFLDVGSFTLNATLGTQTVVFSATLSSTTSVRIFTQQLSDTNVNVVQTSLTITSFVLTGTNSQTGNWMAWIPSSSI